MQLIGASFVTCHTGKKTLVANVFLATLHYNYHTSREPSVKSSQKNLPLSRHARQTDRH